MIPRRDEDGWRDIGPLSWKVARADNHGDRSTTTSLTVAVTGRLGVALSVTRPWR